jgi:histidinol phosphatase-like PHP family hydrolase
MHEFGIPDKLIRLVRATMTDTEAQVKIQAQLTDAFKIRQGLKQGDGLAPLLFNLALEYAIRKLLVNVKGTLEYHTTQIVGYADNICLLSRNIKAIKETYQELNGAAKETGLSINVNKTHAMILTHSRTNTDQQLRIGDHKINMVNNFIYLGSNITEHNNEQVEIQRRSKLANKAYYSLYAIMKSCDIHKKTKIRHTRP